MNNPYDLAERINSEVNARVAYTSDDALYARPEHWETAGRFGDCEDYALAKRALLLAAGWPADMLGLVTCFYGSQGHCVLWVQTDKGSFILDNAHAQPRTPSLLPYTWDAMLCNGEWRQLLGW